jgi:hypothetical protein
MAGAATVIAASANNSLRMAVSLMIG